MARYFSQTLHELGHPPSPSVEALRGLAPLNYTAAIAALRSQDKIGGQSRRLVCRFGLNGGDAWRIPDSDPEKTGGSRTHPDPDQDDTNSEVLRAKFDITPGCMLEASVLYIPSGATQIPNATDWENGGVGGTVKVEIVWYDYDGTTYTNSNYKLVLEGSSLDYGGENTATAGLMKSFRIKRLQLFPPDDLMDMDRRNHWRNATADVRIRLLGGARVVDFSIHEIPSFLVMEADDADSEWVNHMLSTPDPNGWPVHLAYPKEEREGTSADEDQRLGPKQALHVIRNQRNRLAPMLFNVTTYTEEAGSADVTDLRNPINIAGDTGGYVNVLNTAQPGYDATEPGFAMGCGGYARSWLYNNPHVMGTADAEAVAPVCVKLYGSCDVVDCNLRFQTGDYSWIDYTMTNGGVDGWHEFWGWLKVGLNPEQHVVGQLLVDVPATADIDIYYFDAYVLMNYAPASHP